MLRALISSLLALFLALPAAALDLSAMTDGEKAAFGDAVRAYLLDNPQVIMDAVAVLEQRQVEAQAAAEQTLVADNAEAIFNDGFSFVGGNPEGDITLVEFLDYRCGYCRKAHPEVASLLETDGNIRWIVKEFPILGEQSVLASRFAVATRMIAGGDSYKAVSDALMTFQGDITEAALRRLGEGFELDVDAIFERLNGDDVTAELQAVRGLAERLNISGTPTFVLEDELIRGYVPFDQLQAIVEDKRG